MLLADLGAKEQSGSIISLELKNLRLHRVLSNFLSDFFGSSNQLGKCLCYTTQTPMHKHFLSIIALSVSVILGKDPAQHIFFQWEKFAAILQLYWGADSREFLQEEVFSFIIGADFFLVASLLTL